MAPRGRRQACDRAGGARARGARASSLVEVVHDGARAVPADHDHERLGRRRVLLDVDLAGGDVDEIAGPGIERVLNAAGPERVARGPGCDPDRGLAVAVVMDPRLRA